MLRIAMISHSLKGTFANSGPRNPRSIFVQNLSKIGQETKKLPKMGNGVIVMSFLKIAQQFLCESSFYPYLFMYQVSS